MNSVSADFYIKDLDFSIILVIPSNPWAGMSLKSISSLTRRLYCTIFLSFNAEGKFNTLKNIDLLILSKNATFLDSSEANKPKKRLVIRNGGICFSRFFLE